MTNGIYEPTNLPQHAQGEVNDSSVDGKKGGGQSAIFVARNRFAVLNKTLQVRFIVSFCYLIKLMLLSISPLKFAILSNSIVKTIKPPAQTNEIFYGGTGCLILSSPTAVVL